MKVKKSIFSRRMYWNKMVMKYKNLINHLSILKKEGEYEDLSSFEKNFLQSKIENVFRKIERLSKSFGVKVAGTALALLLVSGIANSQTFNYLESVKSSTSTPIMSNFSNIAFSDVDGDGNDDLVVVDNYKFVSYYELVSGNNFTPKGPLCFKSFHLFSNNPTIDFTDIDADGDEDLFIASGYGNVQYYENDNGFKYIELVDFDGTTSMGNSLKFSFADFDDDGYEDIFLGDKNGYVKYAQNNQSGGFGAASNLNYTDGNSIDVGGYSAPALYDLNEDGFIDVFLSEQSGTIVHYQNDGTDKFSTQGTMRANNIVIDYASRISPKWYDFDGDNKKDLIIAGDNNINFYKNNAQVLDAAIQFTSNQLNFGEKPKDIDVLDFDDDGDLDLIVCTDSIMFYQNNGDGTYSYNSTIKADNENINGNSHLSVAFYDLVGNSDIDMLVGRGDSLSVFENNAGTYSFHSVLSDDNGEIRLNDPKPVFENLEGSTEKDLYVASSSYGQIHVFTNNSGSFVNNGRLEVDHVTLQTTNFAFSNINNDGSVDIIYSDGYDEHLFTAINDGYGNFTENDTIKTSVGGVFMGNDFAYTFADNNNDGIDELYYSSSWGIDIFKSSIVTDIKEKNIVDIDFSNVYSFNNNIVVELTDVKNANVEIYNVSGKMILNEKLLNNKTTFNGLEKGLYLVKVYSEKGINLAKVIVE